MTFCIFLFLFRQAASSTELEATLFRRWPWSRWLKRHENGGNRKQLVSTKYDNHISFNTHMNFIHYSQNPLLKMVLSDWYIEFCKCYKINWFKWEPRVSSLWIRIGSFMFSDQFEHPNEVSILFKKQSQMFFMVPTTRVLIILERWKWFGARFGIVF